MSIDKSSLLTVAVILIFLAPSKADYFEKGKVGSVVVQELSDEQNPMWSPDGNYIAFVSDKSGDEDIWIVDADGTNLANLTDRRFSREFDPVWSPDSSRIAFVTISSDRTSDVMIIDKDGSSLVNLTVLTSLHGKFNSRLQWSPDGHFISFGSEDMTYSDIIVMDVNKLEFTNLVAKQRGVYSFSTWSPDSQLVAFVSQDWRLTGFWIAAADGTAIDHIETGFHHDRITWSASSGLIALTSCCTDRQITITLFDRSDENLLDGVEGIIPVWSPNGRDIAFIRIENLNSDIYVTDISSFDVINLTPNINAQDQNPAWSPDGKRIAFESDRGGSFDIWMMDADGTNVKNLTDSQN